MPVVVKKVKRNTKTGILEVKWEKDEVKVGFRKEPFPLPAAETIAFRLADRFPSIEVVPEKDFSL
jgi:hypothetical protein